MKRRNLRLGELDPVVGEGQQRPVEGGEGHAAGACVCTTLPTSGLAFITSVWMGYSMCRGPWPAEHLAVRA